VILEWQTSFGTGLVVVTKCCYVIRKENNGYHLYCSFPGWIICLSMFLPSFMCWCTYVMVVLHVPGRVVTGWFAIWIIWLEWTVTPWNFCSIFHKICIAALLHRERERERANDSRSYFSQFPIILSDTYILCLFVFLWPAS
jgi:hypothetical protein